MAITKNKKLRVFDSCNNHCAYCGRILTVTTFTIDHMKPKSKGGDNSYKNLRPACRECNITKGNNSLDEFRKSILSDKKSVIYKRFFKNGLIKIDCEKEKLSFYFYSHIFNRNSDKTQNTLPSSDVWTVSNDVRISCVQ